MKQRKAIASLVGAVLVGVSSFGAGVHRADATLVTFEFMGEVTSVRDPENNLGGSVAVGDPFWGVYTFESTTPDSLPDIPQVGEYDDAITSIFGQVGVNPFFALGSFSSQIRIVDAVGDSDIYAIRDLTVRSPLFAEPFDFSMVVADLSGDIFADDSLFLNVPDFSVFDASSFNFKSGFEDVSVSGTLTALIPEPSTLALVLIGTIAVIGRRRLRKRTVTNGQSMCPRQRRQSFFIVFVVCTTGLSAEPDPQKHGPGTRGSLRMNIGTDFPLEVPNNPPTSPDVLRRRTTEPAKSVAQGTFLSVQVNIDGFGNNIIGDAANEPSMAIDRTNPDRIVIGWRQFDSIASDFREGGWAYSQDSGQTWTFPGVIEEGVFRSDPVLGVDDDGNFFYCSLGLPNFPQFDEFRADFFKSTDGGVTWNPFVEGFGGDKQWFTIDWTNGVGRGHLYEIWNQQFSCCGSTDFTRSINNGASFQPPVSIPNPKMKWGTLDVGPDGTLYLAGSSVNNTSHVFARSISAQDTGLPLIFDEVKTVNLGPGFTATGGINPAGLLGQVWIATDHSNGPTRGHVYISASLHDPSAVNVLDVWFIRSTDGGDTWSAPIRVNDNPADGAWHWFGTMSVAPNGRIDVIWNDTRNDPGNFLSQVFYSFSIDGGVSWSADQAVSPSFDPSLGYPQQQKMGDYVHMISDLGGANLAYTATFNGEQDVYFMRIPADCDGNGVEDPIDIAGGAADCNGNIIPDVCESAIGGPIITEQPQGVNVCQGEAAILSVTTFAQPAPGFQWRKDGVNIAGATASTLTIDPVTPGDAGNYDVVVSNKCGSSISDVAAVNVTTPAACDDLDACTLDTCLAGTCNHTILQGASCDDENMCTVNDLCDVAGVCLGTARCQLYGDVFPKGPPQGNCLVDIDDVLVVLAGFQDPDECANFPEANLFPCGDDCPPGTPLKVDIDDILFVLGAFADEPTCPHPCPP